MDGKGLSHRVGIEKVIYYLSRFIIGLIFLYASWHKIVHPHEFAKVIYNYKIFHSKEVVNGIAIFLPWLEFYTGIFLIIGVFERGSSLSAFILFLAFIFAILYTIYMGIDTNCGCFNFSESSKVGLPLLLRDILFLLLTSYVVFYSFRKKR